MGIWRKANPFCMETAGLKSKPKMGVVRHGLHRHGLNSMKRHGFI